MKNFTTTLGAAAALLILPALSFAQGKAVYGDDDRLDYFAVSQEMKALSDSTVSLWESDDITEDAAGFKLKTNNFGTYWELCPGEKFREQPSGGSCSASLVGEDLIMTARHCITSEWKCKNTRFVFGYAVKKEGGGAAISIPAADVYGCAKIVTPSDNNAVVYDYALIQLDRKVVGHKPLAVNRSGGLKRGDGVFAIGYPKGLPVKIAGRATVRRLRKGEFTANLDTFANNSGSPVFNARTKLIEGILVGGDMDFQWNPAGCYTSIVNKQFDGQGERVTKISLLSAYIPKLAYEKTVQGTASSGAVNMDSRGIQSLDITSENSRFKLNSEWNKRK
ncbi:MAG: hypothetical protein A2X28_08145 [Elusimicrobia bacterium GWA2_56_46]|nr:MAG: hypothetical protein A2X28_08145 [Elusimicrobia bacterium GWA2_56_46]OGR54274.1 MAG: hypothetical protein A2X39_03565 [Elusimicrobia bacterium GWC2_56_31]HBB66993.1 serine protease [Elusimicrobiota bacterium]HBW22441.1 serine protease [Elusimicrobiota bacterium]